MKRVLISVEGQTEETFIKDILAAHFRDREIHLTPILISNKLGKFGREFKGGLTSYTNAKRDVLKLLNDSNAVAVTTMYDLYGLPTTFPGYNTRPNTPYEKVKHLEDAFAHDINHRRFKPYLQLHEFETFLFVEPDTTATELNLNAKQKDTLVQIKTGFANPEEINDNPNTAPSKRIQSVYEAYDKALDGPYITSSIGLNNIRKSCPHFDEWIGWLENL